MNERLVEDWLTKASERSFQTPFAQSLISDGMSVLRVGHSSHEHGKDIIALDKKGRPHAYQLKDGNLDLKGLEDIQGQLNALVETQIEHPGIRGAPKHFSFLVITGAASFPVEDRIRVYNLAWKKRHYNPLVLITGTDLVSRFSRMAAAFWPQQPEDSRRLLTLYLANGAECLDRGSYAKLLTELLITTKPQPKTETMRRLAVANLFSSYALSPFNARANHWEVLQGWVISASYIAYRATEAKLSSKEWMPTFRVAIAAAREALDKLVTESLVPNALGPGPTFELDDLTQARCTICAGAVSVKMLIERGEDKDWPELEAAKVLLTRLAQDRRLIVWGESAVPFILTTVWGLDSVRADNLSDSLLLSAVRELTKHCGKRSPYKLSSPHESADDATARGLKRIFIDDGLPEKRAAASYTLEPIVLLVARRLWRTALAALWSEISDISIIRLVPDNPSELLLWDWNRQRGSESTRRFGTPQSWKELLVEARADESNELPDILKTEKDFAWLFLLVYPHRLNRQLVKELDKIWKESR